MCQQNSQVDCLVGGLRYELMLSRESKAGGKSRVIDMEVGAEVQ